MIIGDYRPIKGDYSKTTATARRTTEMATMITTMITTMSTTTITTRMITLTALEDLNQPIFIQKTI
jgi:energy-coupling factor transporter transmembrane protein EcfT